MTRLTYRIVSSFLALSLTVTSCDKEQDKLIEEQHFYFEYHTVNHAWGFQYSHWIIDNDGNVLMPGSSDSIIALTAEGYSEQILAFDSIAYQIDAEELDSYISLIPSAATGRVRCEDQSRADFGFYSFRIFYGDSFFMLESKSDLEDCTNLKRDAAKITQWLKSINEALVH